MQVDALKEDLEAALKQTIDDKKIVTTYKIRH